MKTITIGALALLFLAIPSSPDEKKSFRELQWKYPRVRTAAKEKNEVLDRWFREKGVAFPPRAILLRAFKKEALLELWATETLCSRSRISNLHVIGNTGAEAALRGRASSRGFLRLRLVQPTEQFLLEPAHKLSERLGP